MLNIMKNILYYYHWFKTLPAEPDESLTGCTQPSVNRHNIPSTCVPLYFLMFTQNSEILKKPFSNLRHLILHIISGVLVPTCTVKLPDKLSQLLRAGFSQSLKRSLYMTDQQQDERGILRLPCRSIVLLSRVWSR